MADVNVTYEQIEAVAGQLASGHDEITQQLTQLKSIVDQLVETGFVTDSASKTFQQAYEEFNTGVVQTIEGLDTMSRFLTQAARAFQDQDQQLSGLI
jgi:WXG100 family type VII secretion target